jgi:hypothetical protein
MFAPVAVHATDPTTPLVLFAFTAVLVVVACLALTLWPARSVVRRQPAYVLRAE